MGRRSIPERTAVIIKFVELLEELKNMNNFYGVYAVLNGLTMTPVFRLKSSWNLVPSKVKQAFHTMKTELDTQNNFKKYRLMYDAIQSEVPKVGPPLARRPPPGLFPYTSAHS